jgi:hypothetical protein
MLKLMIEVVFSYRLDIMAIYYYVNIVLWVFCMAGREVDCSFAG